MPHSDFLRRLLAPFAADAPASPGSHSNVVAVRTSDETPEEFVASDDD